MLLGALIVTPAMLQLLYIVCKYYYNYYYY